jgi:hypothetical protein
MTIRVRGGLRCRRHKSLKRLDQVSWQRSHAIEDSRGDWFRRRIAREKHLQPRIEIIDVVERHRFGRFRIHWRAELDLAVMRRDEMEQMKPNIFGCRR